MRFSKGKLHFLFFLFYVGEIETETGKQRKWKRPKKPNRTSVFRWSSKNVKNPKRNFSKNCLTLLMSGREKMRIFVHTICFGQDFFWAQNSVNQEAL